MPSGFLGLPAFVATQMRPASAAVRRSGRTSPPPLSTHGSVGPLSMSHPSISPLSVSSPAMSPRSSAEARMALDGQRFGCTTRARATYVAERYTFGNDPATAQIPANMRQNYAPEPDGAAAPQLLRPATADVLLGRQSPTKSAVSRAATPSPFAADAAPRLTRWYKPHTLVTVALPLGSQQRSPARVSFHGSQLRAPARAVPRRAASASNSASRRSARDGRVRAFASQGWR